MQLAHIFSRLKKRFNFEIICIKGRSAEKNIYYSYGEGSRYLTKDFNLNIEPYGRNLFLPIEDSYKIDMIENHCKAKNYSYAILDFFNGNDPHHKITRSSNQLCLGLTSYDLEKDLDNKRHPNYKNPFLFAILDGVNPLTGEILSKENAWRHPQIISDINEHLKTANQKKNNTLFTNRDNITAVIKDTLKGSYDINLVIIQCGAFFEVIEEDAELLIDKFDLKRNNNWGATHAGFPLSSIDKFQEKLMEKNIKFCIVKEINKDNSSNNGVLRQVTYSTDINVIGIQFLKNEVIYKSIKKDTVINDYSYNFKVEEKNSYSNDTDNKFNKNLVKKEMENECSVCGNSFPKKRAELGYTTCLLCGEKEASNKTPKLNEGLPGTREDHKRMRAQVWGEIRNRNKGN